MSVVLSDETAAFILKALEENVLLTSSEAEAVNRALDLEDEAYRLLCEAMGVTRRTIDGPYGQAK